MLRQLANLRRYGRLRTNAPTPRTAKPRLLRDRPDLEIVDVLEFVVADYGKPHDDFFFVQIGAYDGKTADPIFELVHRHGWRGILVEPQLEAFEVLQQNYAGCGGLTFSNVAIGSEDGEITFYTRPGGMMQVASFEKHLVAKPGKNRRQLDERRVRCCTLETLLEENGAPFDFDLLQIDAEGFDYEIIRSIDFSRMKPAIIHYEHMVLSEPERDACLELLASHGYRFLLEDCDTTAYRRPERAIRQHAAA